jgi:ABC-type amino acid transport system permease subunit
MLSAAAVIYFLLILPISVLVQRQEKRLLAKVW